MLLLNECPKVEFDPFCACILKRRIADGLLHPCPVHEMDVRDFDGSGSPAVGCGGGFPCQALFSISMILYYDMTYCVIYIYIYLISISFHIPQGISGAGNQCGLDDERSALLTESFRIYDTMPPMRRPRFLFCNFSLHRKTVTTLTEKPITQTKYLF